MKENILKKIEHDVNYAKNSYSKSLVMECLGFIRGVVACQVLDYSEIATYDRILCRECLNNPEWFNNEKYTNA